MAPRPYWKGYLKLSLVSCAVALYPAASKSERIAFHWLNRETGNRLRQQMVDGESGEPVEREDRVRGYAISKSEYLPIEEDDLDAVEIESSHTIDIETFVPFTEIDAVYLENSHYLAPDDKVAEEAFAVIREAMAKEGVAGLGRAVIAKREKLLVLQPRGKGILATVLHYNYEVRDDNAYFDAIPDVGVSKEMLDLAKHIIHTKLGHFDISKFEDRYENALIEMVKAKQAGRPISRDAASRPANVVNLLDALRNSIAAEKKTGPAHAAPRAKSAKPLKTAALIRRQPERVESAAVKAPEKAETPPAPIRARARAKR